MVAFLQNLTMIKIMLDLAMQALAIRIITEVLTEALMEGLTEGLMEGLMEDLMKIKETMPLAKIIFQTIIEEEGVDSTILVEGIIIIKEIIIRGIIIIKGITTTREITTATGIIFKKETFRIILMVKVTHHFSNITKETVLSKLI